MPVFANVGRDAVRAPNQSQARCMFAKGPSLVNFRCWDVPWATRPPALPGRLPGGVALR